LFCRVDGEFRNVALEILGMATAGFLTNAAGLRLHDKRDKVVSGDDAESRSTARAGWDAVLSIVMRRKEFLGNTADLVS
jgi:hypothetical protein